MNNSVCWWQARDDSRRQGKRPVSTDKSALELLSISERQGTFERAAGEDGEPYWDGPCSYSMAKAGFKRLSKSE